MKTYLYFLLIIIILTSCKEEKSYTEFDEINSYIDSVKSLPNTFWDSENQETNEFKGDLPSNEVDSLMSSKLNGKWIIDKGEIDILESFLTKNYKIIFSDSLQTTMSGWGKITYSRLSKFYITETGFLEYEYYINKKNQLILISYNGRNDDFSFKETPSSSQVVLNSEWFGNNKVVFSLDKKSITLERL